MTDTLKPAVLLCSGGLDSTTLAYELVHAEMRFVPVFINYGQHCATTELRTLETVLPSAVRPDLETIDISGVYRGTSSRLISAVDLWNEPIEDNDLYLPYRNILFLSVGSAYAQARGMSVVYTAFINSNHAKEIDCSAEYFCRLTTLLADFGSVEVRMPFREFSKRKVVELALKLGVPIGATYSCQASSAVPCGACPNCVERLAALRSAEAEHANE
jgi:7-cyano-7-deazaguanine synthase